MLGVCRRLGFHDSDYSTEQNIQLNGSWVLHNHKLKGLRCIFTDNHSMHDQISHTAKASF